MNKIINDVFLFINNKSYHNQKKKWKIKSKYLIKLLVNKIKILKYLENNKKQFVSSNILL